MKTNRLSHSQISRYLQCPRNYKYYYVDKLRERTATAFLPFGSALDVSLNDILYDYKTNGTVTIDYKTLFDKHWEEVEINKVKYPLFDCTLVGYAKADFVFELLTEDDIKFIKAKVGELTPGLKNKQIDELKTFLDEKRSNQYKEIFYEEEHKVLNILNYVSLRRKAHLMLDAYVRDIIPTIEEVKDIQLKIELEADNGDSLVGYIDVVVKFKGESEYCVLDNKSSASPYSPDKVKTSEQLSIYTFALGYKRAAYAVMSKNIKLNKSKVCKSCEFESESKHKTCNNEIDGKRCNGEWTEFVRPEAITQLLVDDITEQNQNVVIENISDVSHAIDNNIFHKNFNTCANFYGNPCPYIGLCWKGKTEDLVDLTKDEYV